jgi:hypothetical protein
MSEPASKEASETANPVAPTQEADTPATSTVHDENHKPTSRSPSLRSHPSSPVPEAAPVVGGAGFVAEPSEKAENAATAFEHHPGLESNGKAHVNEKVTHVTDEENSATATETPIVPKDGAVVEASGEEGEDDDETVYPGGLQLGLLTFGLCVATFTVALGTWFSTLTTC